MSSIFRQLYPDSEPNSTGPRNARMLCRSRLPVLVLDLKLAVLSLDGEGLGEYYSVKCWQERGQFKVDIQFTSLPYLFVENKKCQLLLLRLLRKRDFFERD
jgi:hypothetical protein